MGVDAPAAANPASMPPADRVEAPLLEMRSITKRFPDVLALSDVSFDVRAGEVHALVGAQLGKKINEYFFAVGIDGKLWTPSVAGFPELDNDQPTVPD